MKGRDLLLTIALLVVLAPFIQAQTQPVQVGFSGGVVGVPIKFPDGSATAPSITFANETSLGFFRSGPQGLGYADGGSQRVAFAANTIQLQGTGEIRFLPGSTFGVGADAGLTRMGVGTVSITNGTQNGRGALQIGAANALAVPAGGLGLATVSTSSAGNTGQGARIVVVCGPTAGTASLLFYAGTTNTPVVLANAVGGGLIGC